MCVDYTLLTHAIVIEAYLTGKRRSGIKSKETELAKEKEEDESH